MPLVNFSKDDDLTLLVNSWSKDLNPLLASPIANPTLLKSVALVTGQTNSINHLLGKVLTGWIVIRQKASAIIWDSQDTNPLPNKTLQLLCSSNVTCDLLVF